LRILDICDPDIASVPLTATVKDSIETMLRMHVGAVAVVDAERLVAGIFTERDVLRKVALSGRDPASIPVREVMTSPVELATTATNPGEAMANMVEHHYRHLPIIDDHGRLLGMLSIRHLLQWRVDDLSRELDALEHYASNDGPGG
jgi:CBS domain-containing protein